MTPKADIGHDLALLAAVLERLAKSIERLADELAAADEEWPEEENEK